jgi:hypothetical protein
VLRTVAKLMSYPCQSNELSASHSDSVLMADVGTSLPCRLVCELLHLAMLVIAVVYKLLSLNITRKSFDGAPVLSLRADPSCCRVPQCLPA